MKKPSPLAKYHFWLLLGFVPLFVLIGAIVVDSSVSGKIEEREKILATAKSKVKSGPKSDSEIAAAAEMTKKISSKQGGLHQANWDRQKFLFTWPHDSKGLSQDNAKILRDIEFGETNIERAADRILEADLWRVKFDEMSKASPADQAQKVSERKAAEFEKATTPGAKAERLQSILNDVVSARLKKSEKMPDWLKGLLTELENPEQSLVVKQLAFRKGLLEPAWPKFGESFPDTNNQIPAFMQAYRGVFPLKRDLTGDTGGMADMVLPTQFLGGWHSRLRYINDWGQRGATKDQIWLALEDIWIQRSLLEAVRSINQEMAEFRRCKFDKDGNAVIDPSFDEKGNKIKLDSQGRPVPNKGGGYTYIETPAEEKQKGTFAGRTWAVELAVVKEKNGKNRLAGKIINLTDRLQLMGVNDTMTLNVWFKNSTQPMEFKFGREYLPGKGARAKVPELDKDGKPIPVLDRDGQTLKDADGKDVLKMKDVPANEWVIEPSEAHFLPDGIKTTELARVEQVFDVKTVPVKRIDALVLGYLDSRATAEDKKLQLPREPFGYKEDPVPTDPNAPQTPGLDGSTPPTTPPTTPGIPPVLRPPFGDPNNPMVRKKLSGGDTLVNVTDGNRKRYIEVTPQFRRMPVGMVVIIDQSLIQDMLMAIANSPLRFQITQVEWTRFHGKLDGTTGPGTSPSRDSDIFDHRFGRVNIPGLEESMPIPGYDPNRDRTGGTVSDSQVTSGLVELSIYGVVSLYEKYDPNAPAASSDATGGQTPAPAGQTPTPAPAVPTTPTTTTRPRRRFKR